MAGHYTEIGTLRVPLILHRSVRFDYKAERIQVLRSESWGTMLISTVVVNEIVRL